MPHAHHFLSRLDRVSPPHVELALELYRDDAVLRYVLDTVRLPEGASRVAISLDDPVEGPFLVVTRDGKFVTCLARGMHPDDLPIIPREQLDAVASRVHDLRRRMDAALSVVGKKGKLSGLIDRVFAAGAGLCREDFIAASALQPLMLGELLIHLLHAINMLNDGRKLLRVSDMSKRKMQPFLRPYWNVLWATGHLSVLTFMDARQLLERLRELEKLRGLSVSLGAVSQGVIGIALRGLWAAGKAGKVALADYKAQFAAGGSAIETFDAGAALVVIGNRHSRLRAEVGKALDTPHAIDSDSELDQGWAFSTLMAGTFKRSLEEPEELLQNHRAAGARMVVRLTSRLPRSSAHRYDRPEDVPDDLAFGVLATHRGTFLDDYENAVTLATCLPWIARAKPEQLYLPRAFMQAIDAGSWAPRDTIRMLQFQRHYHGDDLPTSPAQDNPSRSGPCPCGSGKKYKRCCGEDARGQVS